MEILQINKFHYLKGGAEKYCFELSSMLEAGGNPVTHFSMQHPQNFPSDHGEYFVSELDFDRIFSVREKAAAAGRIIYSFEAKRKLSSLLTVRKPHIAHLHNIYHQLSPSILHALADAGVPSVLTAHDYKLVCPNYLLYNEDHICEKCGGGRFYNALFTRCLRKSFLSGIILTAEMYLHRVLGTYGILKKIIAPSRFLLEKLAESGYPRHKLIHVPNFVHRIPESPAPAGGNYIAYIGRLSREKGIGTLIRAVSELRSTELLIAGSGPSGDSLKKLCNSLGAENVSFVGHLSGDEVVRFISGAKFVIIPSEYYENCPLSILETMALGKPVIGAAIGGIPELIDDGVDGILFDAGNVEELRSQISRLSDDAKLSVSMGRTARQKISDSYNKEVHYQRIMKVYKEVLD